LSLESRIKTAIQEVATIFLLDGICIFILRSDGQFDLRYSYGYSENLCFLHRRIDVQSRAAQVARDGKVDVVADLAGSSEQEMQQLRQEGFSSLVYIPIKDKGKNTFGVIRAASRAPHRFGSNELRALELIANRIGVAIENTLLEQDIKRKAGFQAKLIGSSNDGIVATDEQGNVVIFNPPAESIFGYRGEEVIGKRHYRDIYPPRIVEAIDDMMASSDAAEWKIPWLETDIISKEGAEIPVRLSSSILRQKQKKMGIVTFCQDLREIKRLEKELIRAERLAAVGQTVAGMAHCVKNILHGLRGGSYMVNAGIDKDNPERLKTGWSMVQRNIVRTSDLVQDLLSYSKEREPEMVPCRPNDIVEEVIELMQGVAGENNVRLQTELSSEIGEAVMDERSLHRCLLNLVSNAIDACRDDSNPDKAHCVRVATILDPENLIRFDVTDNGSGMSDDVKSKLFSSFFSTKGTQGTGLGLLVTRKLIEEHNGAIEVDSRLDQGSTFSVRLPAGTQS
jgi:PAS domain S-box-containing protein